MEWIGRCGVDGKAWTGEGRFGMAGKERRGLVWSGLVRSGMAGVVWIGMDRGGLFWKGQVRRGVAGTAWMEWMGQVRYGGDWQVRIGSVRLGAVGKG